MIGEESNFQLNAIYKFPTCRKTPTKKVLQIASSNRRCPNLSKSTKHHIVTGFQSMKKELWLSKTDD